MTLFIDEIEFKQQPTYNTCVSACLAMILGADVDEVIAEFHLEYWGVNEGKLKVTDYLKRKGVPFKYCNFEDKPREDGVYLVTVPSLNIKAGTHNILWCMQSAEEEGFFYQRILDPATGRDDKSYYTNLDELLGQDPWANKVSGYSLDLHIPKSYFTKQLTQDEINDLQRLERIVNNGKD